LSNSSPAKGSEFSVQNARTLGGTAGLETAGPEGTNPAARLSQRPSTEADQGFLLTLFAESRPELALLPESVRPALTRMQFDSRRSQYRSSAPDAVDWILELDHDGRAEPVGRCYVQQGSQEHRLLDLAIRSQWRRHGLAGAVLAWLCTGAGQARVPLRLTVWQANHDALRLYQRHGFVADDADGVSELAGYLRLRWSAGAAQ
jgi:GNAT superfamily N-acetyltransferase